MKKFIYNPPTQALDVIYIDQDIIVIDKPSGLLSNPGIATETHDCALTRLQALYGMVILVHRLDCETSGVLIFARHKKAEVHLKKQFEARQTQKTYLAEVAGKLPKYSGTVEYPLISDKQNIPLQKVDIENGKVAITHYKVLRQTKTSSLVELKPVTGRTHQLRVHMLALGNTILGDNFYASGDTLKASKRLCLHALSLCVSHPDTNKTIAFYAPAKW